MDSLEKKRSLLQTLIHNLRQEENLLREGDPHHALEWERENSKILNQLLKIDREISEREEHSLPFRESEIILMGEIYDLAEEAREIQIRVESLLEEETERARQELNEVSIKRQLKRHLYRPDGLYWNKRNC